MATSTTRSARPPLSWRPATCRSGSVPLTWHLTSCSTCSTCSGSQRWCRQSAPASRHPLAQWAPEGKFTTATQRTRLCSQSRSKVVCVLPERRPKRSWARTLSRHRLPMVSLSSSAASTTMDTRAWRFPDQRLLRGRPAAGDAVNHGEDILGGGCCRFRSTGGTLLARISAWRGSAYTIDRHACASVQAFNFGEARLTDDLWLDIRRRS